MKRLIERLIATQPQASANLFILHHSLKGGYDHENASFCLHPPQHPADAGAA